MIAPHGVQVSTTAERIAALYAQSTADTRAVMVKFPDALKDPDLLDRLGVAPKELIHGHLFMAILACQLRKEDQQ